jgi:hypothetical protein
MQVGAVRNPDGYFINTECFREEAKHFIKNKRYCDDPRGSPAWREYWQEQLKRCTEGYSSGGARITGHHYNYLNFAPIQVAEELSEKVARKIQTLPDFWDGDYNYFWALDIARYGILDTGIVSDTEKLRITTLPTEEKAREMKRYFESLGLEIRVEADHLTGGFHVIVGKSRRKGYSYKNGAICANTYNTRRNSLTIIGAFDKKYLYPKGTMGMASDYLNFYNQYTGWGKSREYVDQISHKKASFKEDSIEKGYQSEIMAITFKDNPDAARGKDATYVLLEEAGKFPNLEASYNATEPGLTAGKYMTGQIIIFGTGGDMEDGTVDFANMFYNPLSFNLFPVTNIWDENAENTKCGFFHPVYMNMEGFYDSNGNSDKEGAAAYEQSVRDKIIKSSPNSSVAIQRRVQEYCNKPSEAFLTVNFNNLPIVELRNRLNMIVRENIHLIKGQPCWLLKGEDGIVRAKPDLKGELTPIWFHRPKTQDTTGAVVVYENPVENAPRGLYKIGYDPYRQDLGTSLASIIVYKGFHKYSHSRNKIVAEYIGRPGDPDDVNRIAEQLAEMYNTQVMYENEVTHVKTYFQRRKKLHLLAEQPDRVISKNIKESKVARVYGCHMTDQLKDAGEKYIKTWLLTETDVDENGDTHTIIDTLESPGLIEDLILFNRKGNFDRTMSLMMVMFQIEEEELGKQYGSREDSGKLKESILLLEQQQFRKNTSFR